MELRDAVLYVNGMRYKPGWSFKALPAGFDTIRVEVYIDTVDSVKADAPLGYPSQVTLDRSFYIDNVSEKNTLRLDEYVFMQIADVELHESREFFRVTHQGWNAPFHPHTPDGERRFAALTAGGR